MTDSTASTGPLDVIEAGDGEMIWQRFSVPYEFPVAFSEGLF